MRRRRSDEPTLQTETGDGKSVYHQGESSWGSDEKSKLRLLHGARTVGFRREIQPLSQQIRLPTRDIWALWAGSMRGGGVCSTSSSYGCIVAARR